MYERYKKAGHGLEFIVFAMVVNALSLLVAFLPLVGGVMAVVCVVGSGLLYLFGLYTASEAHPQYKLALYLVVINVILRVVGTWVLGRLFGMVSCVAGFLTVYLICTATAELLEQKGDVDLAVQAKLVWKLYALCTLVSLVVLARGWLPLLGTLLSVLDFVNSFAALLAVVLMGVFYHNASKSLLR